MKYEERVKEVQSEMLELMPSLDGYLNEKYLKEVAEYVLEKQADAIKWVYRDENKPDPNWIRIIDNHLSEHGYIKPTTNYKSKEDEQ